MDCQSVLPRFPIKLAISTKKGTTQLRIGLCLFVNAKARTASPCYLRDSMDNNRSTSMYSQTSVMSKPIAENHSM